MGFEQAVHRRGVYALRTGHGWPCPDGILYSARYFTRPNPLPTAIAGTLWTNTLAALTFVFMLTSCASPNIVESPDTQTRSPGIGVDHARMDDGYRLPLRVWTGADQPQMVVLGLHGFNDYANAFAPLGRELASAGITTYAVDQRGFGAAALPGRWHGSERLVADLRNLVDLLRARHPDARLYVVGESMGGAVVLAATAQGPLPVDGLILIAPAVWSRDTMPWYQRLALDGAVRTLPWLKLTGEGIRLSPSDHVEMLQAMGADPLVIKATRVDALWGITDLMDRAQAAAHYLQTPALLLYGEHDEIIPKNAFCRFLGKLPRSEPGLTFALYEHGWHMLPRDRQGARVRADIAAWLEARDAPLPSGETTSPHGPRASAFCGKTP
ncbi:Lysophospholipase [Thiocapsa sp. KS1]|nr:Lysophospholipase [Thiocapsa sp. KS1]